MLGTLKSTTTHSLLRRRDKYLVPMSEAKKVLTSGYVKF